MSRLSDFPHPSPSGAATVCERNSRLVCESNIGVLDYRKISVKEAFAHTKSLACSEMSCKEIFKNTTDETLLETLRNKWSSDGLGGVLKELSHMKQTPQLVQSVLLKCCVWINSIRKLRESILTSPKMAIELPQRKTLFTCHPHTGRLAVIIKESTVKVLNLNRIGESDQEVILRDKRISLITCLSWRPKSSISIAAGSTSGIMVWLLDPNTVTSIKPGSHLARFLSTDEMTEVTSISWCADGKLLACSCKNSSYFWVWNILSQSSTPIHRVGSNLSFVNWSPCKQRLLTTSNSSTFRIWETLTWSCEKWENLNGKCTSSCWSSCGTYLLFSVSDESVIYYTSFFSDNCGETIDIAGSGTALKCADVSAVSFPNGDSEISIGGSIADMSWDPTDSRLAVLFHGDSTNQPYIALYHTRKQPNLQLIPCGFIRGNDDETPLGLDFVRGYEKGSLLSVYWSSEEISFVPLLFNHSLSPLIQKSDVSIIDSTVHPSVDEIGEVPSMHNNVTLYSAE